jgi:hypothetical protein
MSGHEHLVNEQKSENKKIFLYIQCRSILRLQIPGGDRKVIGSTTTHAISAYHHSVLLVEEVGVPGENH